MTRFVRAIEPGESEHGLRPKVRLALRPTPCPCHFGWSLDSGAETHGRPLSQERSAVGCAGSCRVPCRTPVLSAAGRANAIVVNGNLPSSPIVGDGVASLTDGYVAGGVG